MSFDREILKFKDDFVWGAATSAYQIEGSVSSDGRGPSVWDAFCQKPGNVFRGEDGSTACDHVNRLHEDLDLMAILGLQAYRFSVSWSRVLPNGVGSINEEGLLFYDRLIDGLLERDIEPYLTLFHWDFPQALQEQGGWLNPDVVQWFSEYTELLCDRYSDRVSNWFTLNEPPCFLGLGHKDGRHAPGLTLTWPEFFQTVKNALMAHGQAVRTLREYAKLNPRIGYVPISHIGIPATESDNDIRAARNFTFGIPSRDRGYWFSRLYLDPVVLGEWPEECIAVFTDDYPTLSTSEERLISTEIDFLGLNFYSAPVVRAGENGQPEVVETPAGSPRTAFDWPVTEDGMYWSVRFHEERYGLPMMIAENGMSGLDWVNEVGRVPDYGRIDFLSRYLRSLHRAQSENYQINGYFHWSLMDNFEWAEGYRHRFGLIHVDFQTQARTIKDSGYWYRDVIRSNGIPNLAEDRTRPISMPSVSAVTEISKRKAE
ncbi:GH1 family beta-glucosidase [Kamptonema cortianum]|nr:GH1 family beta-glucosidase [Geitlerinema splendidum]MDK3158450.1 GH1 family beta-glucosidase [Kamptonema cortianum]